MSMRILFEMYHPGFLRNFEGCVRRLADRGHEIVFAFERPARLGEDRLVESLCAAYPAISAHYLKKEPKTLDRQIADAVRTAGDYLRYVDPRYATATALRERAARKAPGWARRFGASPVFRSGAGRSAVSSFFRAAEVALPPSPQIEKLIESTRPDLVLVTPLVGLGSSQADIVKVARKLGIPCALGVASWDNLTNKGVIRAFPDRVLVWNEVQRNEAASLHGIPRDRVDVCGAWTYDHWFGWELGCKREEFLAQVGLDPSRDYLLYVCSSPFIAPTETGFVRRWIGALRSSPESALRDIGVLVRPHPQNAEQWRDEDLSDFDNAIVWPRAGANPIGTDSRNDYFRSLAFSRGIVGINTSAQIEAGIVGRPVFTITDPEFAATQGGTLHFQHLTSANGGLLHTADTLGEHLEQVSTALADPEGTAHKSRRFVEYFVRPNGLDAAGVDRFVASIEGLAGSRPDPAPVVAPAMVRPFLALWKQGLGAASARGRRNAHAVKPGSGGQQ